MSDTRPTCTIRPIPSVNTTACLSLTFSGSRWLNLCKRDDPLSHLFTTASQAKLFRFVLQHLFGRTNFSVTDRVQPLFFKCLSSDAIITFSLSGSWSSPFFVVYFGVEMFEQSVKLSRLIIFYFISNFLLYAPLSPNREPKTSAFRSVFVFRAVFKPLYSCFGGKSKYMCYKRQASLAITLRFLLETGLFNAIQMAHLIGSQWVPLFINQSECHVCYSFLHSITFFLHRVTKKLHFS